MLYSFFLTIFVGLIDQSCTSATTCASECTQSDAVVGVRAQPLQNDAGVLGIQAAEWRWDVAGWSSRGGRDR